MEKALKNRTSGSEFCNLRPVSNLQFISKLTERAVLDQLHSHMVRFDLYPALQSAYRQGHSTEIALVKLHNDILLNMDKKRVTLVVFLDLSAAFDTVDNEILCSRLSSSFIYFIFIYETLCTYYTYIGRQQQGYIIP